MSWKINGIIPGSVPDLSGTSGGTGVTTTGGTTVSGPPPSGGGIVSDGGSGGSWQPIPGVGPWRDQLRGLVLTKYGVVLAPGAGGTFDAGGVCRPTIWFDEIAGRYGALYYALNGSGVGSIGLMWSNDLVTWTRDAASPILSPTGSGPDATHCINPFMWYENGQYSVLYTGVSGSLHSGTYTLCLATGTSIYSLTKQGSLGLTVDRFSMAAIGGTYYGWYNKPFSGGSSIYCATAPAVAGTWTEMASAILGPTAAWETNYIGRPHVVTMPTTGGGVDLWMAYAGYNPVNNGYPEEPLGKDAYAFMSVDAAGLNLIFPQTWVKHSANPILVPTAATYDAYAAGEPTLYMLPGQLHHFYTAMASSGAAKNIALAVTVSAGAAVDHKVLVDGSDTTAGYLGAKLAAGAGVTLTTLNPGANEQVQISTNPRTFAFFAGG